jgi:hypothetical protein
MVPALVTLEECMRNDLPPSLITKYTVSMMVSTQMYESWSPTRAWWMHDRRT